MSRDFRRPSCGDWGGSGVGSGGWGWGGGGGLGGGGWGVGGWGGVGGLGRDAVNGDGANPRFPPAGAAGGEGAGGRRKNEAKSRELLGLRLCTYVPAGRNPLLRDPAWHYYYQKQLKFQRRPRHCRVSLVLLPRPARRKMAQVLAQVRRKCVFPVMPFCQRISADRHRHSGTEIPPIPRVLSGLVNL